MISEPVDKKEPWKTHVAQLLLGCLMPCSNASL
nr:MAG TPA: hypothetical protein [Caudoviricetes sp.]